MNFPFQNFGHILVPIVFGESEEQLNCRLQLDFEPGRGSRQFAPAFASTIKNGKRRPKGVTCGSLISVAVSCKSNKKLRAAQLRIPGSKSFIRLLSDNPMHMSGRGPFSLNIGTAGNGELDSPACGSSDERGPLLMMTALCMSPLD